MIFETFLYTFTNNIKRLHKIIEMKGTYLGEFEELVLLCIAVLYEEAYGVNIKKNIEEQANRKVSIGAVHAAVNRPEEKGFLRSNFGEPSKSRGGKRKKLYNVTNAGKEALQTAMQMRQKFWNQLPDFVVNFA